MEHRPRPLLPQTLLLALPSMLLGQTLEQTGDMEAARQAYNRALEIDPQSADARDLLVKLDQTHALSAAPTP